jgi:hypothetical protein
MVGNNNLVKKKIMKEHNQNIPFEYQIFLNKLALLIMPLLAASGFFIYQRQYKEDENFCYDNPWDFRDLMSYLGGLIISPMFFATLFTERINSAARSLAPLLPGFMLNDARLRRMNNLKHKIELFRAAALTAHDKSVLERLNSFALTMRQYYLLGNSESDSPDLYWLNRSDSYASAIDYILKLHTEPQKHIVSLQNRQQLNAALLAIDNLLVHFPSAIATRLRNEIIERLIGNIIDNKKLPITAFCLHGAPGTGKTWFVTELARILDIPCKTLKLNEIRNVCSLSGGGGDSNFDVKLINPVVKLLHQIRATGKNAGIIFIDEIDKTFDVEPGKEYLFAEQERFLLDLLNAIVTEYTDPYLETPFDISNILFICACNKLLSEINKRLAPIQDRMQMVLEIPNLTPELKLKIFMKHARVLFAQQRYVMLGNYYCNSLHTCKKSTEQSYFLGQFGILKERKKSKLHGVNIVSAMLPRYLYDQIRHPLNGISL